MTAYPITEAATASLPGGIHQTKGGFASGEKKQDGEGFPHTTQSGIQLKTHEFFTSGPQLIISDFS